MLKTNLTYLLFALFLVAAIGCQKMEVIEPAGQGAVPTRSVDFDDLEDSDDLDKPAIDFGNDHRSSDDDLDDDGPDNVNDDDDDEEDDEEQSLVIN